VWLSFFYAWDKCLRTFTMHSYYALLLCTFTMHSYYALLLCKNKKYFLVNMVYYKVNGFINWLLAVLYIR